MINPSLVHLAPLFTLLVWAAISDLRVRKIRNWLTLSLMLTGLWQSFMALHTVSPLQSLLGLFTGFGITFILFAMGALGAGDVKLLAGVGAWLGPWGALLVFLIESVIGMVIVVSQALWQRKIRALLRNSALVLVNMNHVREVGMEHVTATGKSLKSIDRPLPYAVPVLLAVAWLAIQSYITARH